MAQSCIGVLVAGRALGTEEARWLLLLVSIWLWFIAFLWTPIIWLYFMDDSGLVLLGKGWLLSNSSHLLLLFFSGSRRDG